MGLDPPGISPLTCTRHSGWRCQAAPALPPVVTPGGSAAAQKRVTMSHSVVTTPPPCEPVFKSHDFSLMWP